MGREVTATIWADQVDQSERPSSIWEQELEDLLRGLSGGFLIGVPLIYTMETWWIGETATVVHTLAFLAIAYLVNLLFIIFAGFRRQETGSS